MKAITLLLLGSLLYVSASGQNLILGQVTNHDKDPLVGVNILIKGSSAGTVTDANGAFELYSETDSPVLVCSYVGYQTKEFQTSSQSNFIILEEDEALLETVLVTGFVGTVGQARRRAASVQQIPESVVTYTSEHIERSGISTIGDFAQQVPNLSFSTSQNIGVNFLSIRGIPQIRNGESPVAFLIDGVTIQDPNLINQELYDLAMVEVVKGPQGTLYGKNAIGGAINILTASPTNHFKHKLKAGYGNGKAIKTFVSSSGPILKNKLYYRLAGSSHNKDGLIHNDFLDKKVDFYKDLSLRGQLKFDLNSVFTATLSGQYSDTEGGATYYGHAPQGTQLDANDFDYLLDSNVLGKSWLESTFGSLSMRYFLGKVKLQSITSYTKADRLHRGDLDSTPADVLRQEQFSNSKTFNQEIRLSSVNHNNKLSWDLGAFYQQSDKDLITNIMADPGFFANPPMPTGQLVLFNFVGNAPLSDFTNKFTTLAFFSFFDYQLTEQLTLALGFRYDYDQIEQDNRNENTKPKKTENVFQPKVSVSYQPNQTILLYANYGRGYRSAGFNALATPLFDAEYKAEISNNFELGLKTSHLDNRLIANLAGFYGAFNNQQQFAVALGLNGLTLGNYNFPKSRVYGMEVDVKYRVLKQLDLFAAYGINKSKITEGGMSGTTDRTALKDNNTPFVPQTTFNVGLQSSFPINAQLEFTGYLNLSNKGKIYWHDDNNDFSDPYTLLNGKLGLVLDNNYELSIWGSNITDTPYYLEYGAGEVNGNAAGDGVWPGQPATYGVELAVKF